MIRECWAKVEWGHGRILVRDGANAGWIDYMLKDRQKSEFDGFLDCIIIESLHNPISVDVLWNRTLRRLSLSKGDWLAIALFSAYAAPDFFGTHAPRESPRE